jgi:hypothetical protein
MTVLEYSIASMILGVPVGFVFGIAFAFGRFLEKEYKEMVISFLAVQILCPLAMFLIMFAGMGWFSIFIDSLTIF